MPYNRKYTKKPVKRAPRRKVYRKKPLTKYRGTIARIPRAIPMKSKAVMMKVVYFNQFHCRPGLDSQGNQQNYWIKLNLNSPWLFPHDWKAGATGIGQNISSNSPIVPLGVGGTVADDTTIMPGLKETSMYNQYGKLLVCGTKVKITCSPTANEDEVQTGRFYTVKHAKNDFGLIYGSRVDQIDKLPFRKSRILSGPSHASGGASGGQFQERNVGCSITETYSPKKFNGVKDLADNEEFYNLTANANAPGTVCQNVDHLSIGIVPSLNNYLTDTGPVARQATNFKMNLRVEQLIKLSEPLEALNTAPQGNWSLPWRAGSAYVAGITAMNYYGM